MKPHTRPSDAWQELYMLRREVHRLAGAVVFSDELMWNIFVGGLRPEGRYTSLADGFSQHLTIDDRLARLDEKWHASQPIKGREKSFPATTESFDWPSDEDFDETKYQTAMLAGQHHRGMSRSARRHSNCFKCGSSKHIAIACKWAEDGFKAAKAARIRAEGEESDEDRKIYQLIQIRSSGRSLSRSPKSYGSRENDNYQRRQKSPDHSERSPN